jgi:hypothetical protein
LIDPKVAIEHFASSLVSGGVFIASVPNEKHYPFVAENFKDDEYPHRRHYTPDEFEGLLVPFRVEKMYCQRSKLEPEIIEGTEGRFIIAIAR